MYFTALPDHTAPGFDENDHFSRFSRHNVIFNALSSQSQCDGHVGCLSLKTVLDGEEWYEIDRRQMAIRPGYFLILNDNQTYSCRIHKGAHTRVLSVFFQKDFAAAAFRDMLSTEHELLDDPFGRETTVPDFVQTLRAVHPDLNNNLSALILYLDHYGPNPAFIDESLVFLLQYLLRTYRADKQFARKVEGIKPATKKEIYKRLCVAKDILHSSWQSPLDLANLGGNSGLSRPQLIRQFKAVFGRTPHRYLVDLRLGHAAELLRRSSLPIREIAWHCGFNDPSAFCRAFRTAHGTSPERFRLHP